MFIKSLFSRKDELVDKIENFCFGLKSYIRDVKIAKGANLFFPSLIKLKDNKQFITENKYKSFLVTFEDSKRYSSKIIIQECRRQGKIINGKMVPEPIKDRIIEIDIKSLYTFIDIFRRVGYNYYRRSN
tara:strand:- start:205 stop:591 length:387 start_codon:yes stop_codon:yes gene_type:complete